MPRVLIGTILALAALTPTLATAQTHCAERDKVISKLEAGYGEAFAGGGMQNSTSIFEVWFSSEGGTWTILMTRADGMSCVMASGTDWREALPGMEKPAGIPG